MNPIIIANESHSKDPSHDQVINLRNHSDHNKATINIDYFTLTKNFENLVNDEPIDQNYKNMIACYVLANI